MYVQNPYENEPLANANEENFVSVEKESNGFDPKTIFSHIARSYRSKLRLSILLGYVHTVSFSQAFSIVWNSLEQNDCENVTFALPNSHNKLNFEQKLSSSRKL